MSENQKPVSDSTQNEDRCSTELSAEQLESVVETNPQLLERLLDNPKVVSIIQHKTSLFQGPLPPPDMLREYDSILPGMAERILELTEKEQQFRHETQKTALNAVIRKDTRGQWMACVLSIIILGIAVYFGIKGELSFAAKLITGNLIAIAAIFAIGRIFKSKDEEDS
ncbi:MULTISPECIES: DUF2335 domain-containing protein [Xenorhabdus]|uniref:DUF2335 domain-containing protein n=1 Tax=Xenorhabdus TaxID=626 RepID=UPI000648738C|nr:MULTISPECIES: DUF2335 domain-containing protein [Xenorhabdus]